MYYIIQVYSLDCSIESHKTIKLFKNQTCAEMVFSHPLL